MFVNNLLNLYKSYPDAEVRALALHYRETLRPGYDVSLFQVDVDRLIETYRPKNKQPQATRYIPGVSGEINVCTRQEAKKRGRPAGENHRAQLLAMLQATAADSFGRVPVDTAILGTHNARR